MQNIEFPDFPFFLIFAYMTYGGGQGGRHGGQHGGKKIEDMESDMVAHMQVVKVANMEVDKVADVFKTKCIKPEMFLN